MPRTIGLAQLAQKKFTIVALSALLQRSIGDIEDSFDAIIYGESGNGKSNFTAHLIKELIMAIGCKCEYVAYEEGHGRTIQKTLIEEHKLLELGNVVQLTDHYTFNELQKRMARKQSAKIWVIDSLQAAKLTPEQCATLKQQFVLSRKKKIIIYISWSDGKKPDGAAGKSVEYYANIKMRVQGLVMFPKSRYGGNKPFVIWEQGARDYWKDDYDHMVHGKKKKPPPRIKSKPKQKKLSDLNPTLHE